MQDRLLARVFSIAEWSSTITKWPPMASRSILCGWPFWKHCCKRPQHSLLLDPFVATEAGTAVVGADRGWSWVVSREEHGWGDCGQSGSDGVGADQILSPLLAVSLVPFSPCTCSREIAVWGDPLQNRKLMERKRDLTPSQLKPPDLPHPCWIQHSFLLCLH